MSVYLLRAGESGPVKFGKADDPMQRVAALQTAHYETLRLLRVWQGGSAEETSLRLRFADLRIRGDWFGFSRAMLGYVGLVEIDPASIPQITAERVALAHNKPLQEIITAWLEQSGSTPFALATNAGLKESAVRDIMRGRSRNPRLDTLSALAHVMGVPVGSLLGIAA